MAGARSVYRNLSRTSAHRQALLRNLVTSLIKHESIQTTWHKAKEAQRVAERLITMAKRNNETSRRHAAAILFSPEENMPKLFNEIRQRYQDRPGGYTRVLRTTPKDEDDQAPSAILELVDGTRDMRFAITAATVARDQRENREHTDLTRRNMLKVTRYRKDGKREFGDMVEKMSGIDLMEEPRREEAVDSKWGPSLAKVPAPYEKASF